jgi:hypothetical protein
MEGIEERLLKSRSKKSDKKWLRKSQKMKNIAAQDRR